MKLSDVAFISFLIMGICLLAWILSFYLFKKQPILVLLKVKVKPLGDKVNIEVFADALFSSVHLQTFNYSLNSVSEFEAIIVKFMLMNFEYTIDLKEHISLRDAILDGRDFYLNFGDSDKVSIKLTLNYQKSKARIQHTWELWTPNSRTSQNNSQNYIQQDQD